MFDEIINEINEKLPSIKETYFKDYPFDIRSKFHHALLYGDRKEVEKCLIELSNNREFDATLSLRKAKNKTLYSCATLSNIAAQIGIDTATTFALTEGYMELIEKTQSFESLERVRAAIYVDFTTRIFKRKDMFNYSTPVRKSIFYIKDHLNEKITLKVVAESIDIGAKYLSHKFKSETGYSFIDYINKARIEKAKHYMIFSSMSLPEISLLLGFCNQSYFTKQFKRYEGITPKEYMKK